MERNRIVLLTFFLGLALFGCKKEEPEIIEPKITNDNVEVTSTSASFTWMVDWVGKRISVVEVSEDVDMNDSQFYGSEEEINASSFSTTANDLKPATKYYYRFWVWNQNYANNRFVFEKKSFSTPSDLPVVKTLDVINITRTSATVQGEVISDGGVEITERGICWGTEHNPTITGNHISDEEGIGTYSFEITELIADETYYVRAYAKNKVGIAYGEEKSFTTGDAVLPTVTTSDITNISWTTAKGGGEVLLDGDAEVTERGVCWSTSHNPTISDNTVQSGLGIGEFVVNLSGLIAGTTYYVKAYAKNRIGISYGEEKSFTSANPELPTITTKSVTDITRTTAIGGGIVVSEGGAEILECGICWGMSTQPTIEGFHDVSEQGLDFSILMDNLNVEETYYVRAYAINSVGIAYGNVVSFTTSNADIPTVLTSYIADITSTTARGGGDVTDDGGANVTERGLCWGLFPNPTINDNHANNGTGLGSYVINMNELTPGTTYYVRAYAKNRAGISYGAERSFVTAFYPVGAINGLFSVSANKQVYFSQGNLQYQASTNLWRFAESQMDYIGEANSNITPTNNGWIDLFGWGTSGYDHGSDCYQPWSISQTDSDYYVYGNFIYNLEDKTGQADWGYNSISNGGNTTQIWRTLTFDEWHYLIAFRQTNSDMRFAKAKVNGVCGIILFPDNWSSDIYNLNNINNGGANYNNNSISASNWLVLENKGAVFLPSAGFRDGVSVSDADFSGRYWSSSSYVNGYDNIGASYLFIWSQAVTFVSDYYRHLGYSVRLVQDH